MKLAVVVQRYGASINGGAELHARYIAELLARHHKVEALTTCASDYVTWRNESTPGTETLRGVTIRRFPVSRERDPRQFGHHSRQVFERRHSLADELAWLDSEGPTSPAMIEYIRAHADDYDYLIFFSYRYYHAYHGARAVPHKAILVPTAERDPAVALALFGPLFRGVRAIMYNSHEERAMIRAAAHNDDVPGVIVGVGSDVPRTTAPDRFRQKFDVHGPFVIYVGRIDENKGCRELFNFFTAYRPSLGQRLQLLLIGNSILPIPNHPNIRHLGYVTDQDKFDAIAASEALVMPSYYESLSMVALEAWALGRPVLANGHCDVLRGQCIRSRAGLYYENLQEFCETLFTLTTHRQLNAALGENGRRFFEQHYTWPVIERKYLDMLKRLASEDAQAGRGKEAEASRAARMEPLPGWLARRRRTVPPALTVLDTLPKGAAVAENWIGGTAPGAARAAGAGAAAGVGTGVGSAAAGAAGTAARAGSGTQAAPAAAGGPPDQTPREGRDAREARESRGAHDSREARDARGDSRGGQDERAREPRDERGGGRDRASRETRDSRDARGGRGGRDRRAEGGRGSARGERGERESGTSDEPRGREPRDTDARGRREGREARQGREGARENRGAESARGREPRDGVSVAPEQAQESRAAGGDNQERDARERGDAREAHEQEGRSTRGDRRGRDRRGRDRDRDRNRDRERRVARGDRAAGSDARDETPRESRHGEAATDAAALGDSTRDRDSVPRAGDSASQGSSTSPEGTRAEASARDDARRGRRGRGHRGRGRSGHRGPGSASGSGSDSGSGSSGSGSQGGGA